MIETLAQNRILDRIGAGGMGEVFRARDTRLGRTVAIKVLPEHVAADPGQRERFLQEARASVRIGRDGGRHDLDGDRPTESSIPRAKDLAQSAFADPVQEPVLIFEHRAATIIIVARF